MTQWLIRHWVATALCMACLLLLLTPVFAASFSLGMLLLSIQLPIYMLHQVEEHTSDRFRIFVNTVLFGGAEALTPLAVLWINLPGVWGVNIASLYAACFIGIGWGLSAPYLALVNAPFHVAASIAFRRYNPGLWTSLALFMPLGALAVYEVN